jgi:hypothetical protein
MKVLGCAVASALLAGVSVAEPIPSIATRDTPTVDLGYSVYSGSYDAANDINVFKGYASSFFAIIELETDVVAEFDMLRRRLASSDGPLPNHQRRTGQLRFRHSAIRQLAPKLEPHRRRLPSMASCLPWAMRIVCS